MHRTRHVRSRWGSTLYEFSTPHFCYRQVGSFSRPVNVTLEYPDSGISVDISFATLTDIRVKPSVIYWYATDLDITKGGDRLFRMRFKDLHPDTPVYNEVANVSSYDPKYPTDYVVAPIHEASKKSGIVADFVVDMMWDHELREGWSWLEEEPRSTECPVKTQSRTRSPA